MANNSQQLLHHINSQDPHIQFTMEGPKQDGSLKFLDTQVSPGPNNTLITRVCRKPTHTDQYLHWDSHFIGPKYSVFNTLAHRAKVVSHNQKSLHKELDHIRKALQASHFPTWMLNRLQQKFECKHQTNNEPSSMDIHPNNNTNNTGTNSKNSNISIVVPYIHGLGERFKRTCNNKEMQVHFKGTNTIKDSSWHPRTGTANCKRLG